jgi:hypothetical protein
VESSTTSTTPYDFTDRRIVLRRRNPIEALKAIRLRREAVALAGTATAVAAVSAAGALLV